MLSLGSVKPILSTLCAPENTIRRLGRAALRNQRAHPTRTPNNKALSAHDAGHPRSDHRTHTPPMETKGPGGHEQHAERRPFQDAQGAPSQSTCAPGQQARSQKPSTANRTRQGETGAPSNKWRVLFAGQHAVPHCAQINSLSGIEAGTTMAHFVRWRCRRVARHNEVSPHPNRRRRARHRMSPLRGITIANKQTLSR